MHSLVSFIGITPNTPDNGCPAVYVDEDYGDIWIQGEAVTDPGALAEVGRHSPIGPGEAAVKGAAGHEVVRDGGSSWDLRARSAGTGAASPA
jgi:hypothetical protein